MLIVSLGCAGAIPEPPAITLETVEIVTSLDGCMPDTEGCTYARLSFPRASSADPGVAERINTAIDTVVGASTFEGGVHAPLEGVGEELLEEYRAFRQEFPDLEIPWALERTATVVHDGEGVLSVAIDEYAFLGGAHPNTRRTYLVFDAASGRRMALTDMVEESRLEELTRRAEAAFRAAVGIAAEGALAEEGFWFEDDRFALNDNWALVADGLAFHFDPYEVTAYAFGPTDFVVAREQLADLATADSPLAAATSEAVR